jgi:hypothetical protein
MGNKTLPQGCTLCVGTIGTQLIQYLVNKGYVNATSLKGKREKYVIINTVPNKKGSAPLVVVAGSDKRGTIYGIYELSRQMGVSPWYWWADVPTLHHDNVFVRKGTFTDGEPAVVYRGIFLNDEAPCLTGWARANYGGRGFVSGFYKRLFELILRLKGNFLWPAMWGNAFYDDDAANGPLANEMGIIMGTSHHEPMCLAQQDWKRRGHGAWDYQTNGDELRRFWRTGIERAINWEKVVTVGMRGDGDMAMGNGTNISLLEKIVADQRNIIADVTGKPADCTPQVWALYKEVQDYYDQGMRVPDDVTLLLCDDNWGDVRRLPELNSKPRRGGYGMYYHVDYVGGPRNYKWINVSQIQRIWEQMNLSYEYGVRKLWVLNVGDLKPMEYPITFWFDMAWNPKRFNASNLYAYTVDFCRQQFGENQAEEAARILNLYCKYNYRVTPELLNDRTYSLDYGEWQRVVSDYSTLSQQAEKQMSMMPLAYRDVYDELVLFPVMASANLYNMYYALAMNRHLAAQNDPQANFWASRVRNCYQQDSVLCAHYNHDIAGGKWNHMMDQVHIGYTFWNDPRRNSCPATQTVNIESSSNILQNSGDNGQLGNQPYSESKEANMESSGVSASSSQSFHFNEKDGYVSFEAEHTSERIAGNVKWTVIPYFGKTLSGITTMPTTLVPSGAALVYEFTCNKPGKVLLHSLLAPTLNFSGKGMWFSVQVNDGLPIKVNATPSKFNVDPLNSRRINEVVTEMNISKAGRCKLRICPLSPAIVFEKFMVDCGGLKRSYLGAPETL